MFRVRRCFFNVLVFLRFFFFERTRPAASMRSPCLIYLSTSISGKERLPFIKYLALVMAYRYMWITVLVVSTDSPHHTPYIPGTPQ